VGLLNLELRTAETERKGTSREVVGATGLGEGETEGSGGVDGDDRLR
jgi:hypothetical protein